MVTSKPSPEEPVEICPYWREVAADFLSTYPAGGYCIAGCHKRIKVMADQTLHDVCAMNFAECEGYQRLLAEEEAKVRRNSGTPWG